MRVGAVIQARMTSRRCPGKVLRQLAGQPLLAYVVESIQQCQRIDQITVATSDDPSDDPIARFCQAKGLHLVRGSLHNVAERFFEVASHSGWDAMVRISGDSPLMDHRLVDHAAQLILPGETDLVTNVFPRTYPRGQSVEVIRTAVFRHAFPAMMSAEDQEHVTPYFYRNWRDFRIHNFTSDSPQIDVHLAVDDEADFVLAERLVDSLNQPVWRYRWHELAARAADFEVTARGGVA